MKQPYVVRYGGQPVKSALNIVQKFPEQCPQCNRNGTTFKRYTSGCDWVLCRTCNFVAWLNEKTD
jgi:ribosomal protein L37AE/L43A